MRPLEITLLISILVSFLLIKRSRSYLRLPVFAGIAQLMIEGYRWQLLPAYALAVICLIMSIQKPPKRNFWSVAWWALLYLTLIVGVMLPILLPIPQPAPPTGAFPVGTTTFYFLDESRTDPYAPDPNSPREILVQVWYPAQKTDGTDLAPWMENAGIVARGVSDWLELPSFTFDHLIYAKSHSFIKPPALTSGGPFPVLLFSHGYGGFRAQNTFQVQELASQGYIVAAIEHTYGSVVTVFPDGRIAPHNEDTLLDGDEYETSFEALVAQWSDDLSFTLNRLTEINGTPNSLLAGTLDLDRVSAFGHSTGGGTALQFCFEDDRCSSAFGMDPALASMDDNLLTEGYPKPFFVVFSEVWAMGRDKSDIIDLLGNAKSQFGSYYIEGTAHYDFSDLPAASPLAHAMELKGPIDGDRVLKIINDLTLAYFGQGLKGQPETWLSAPQEVFPEVVPYNP